MANRHEDLAQRRGDDGADRSGDDIGSASGRPGGTGLPRTLPRTTAQLARSPWAGVSVQRKAASDAPDASERGAPALWVDLAAANETLPTTVGREQATADRALQGMMGWGAADTTEWHQGKDGKLEAAPRSSAIMDNAKEHGAQDRLVGLSHEIEQIEPLLRAWMSADVTCNTIAGVNGIEIDRPQAYAKGLGRTIGRQMQNTKDDVGKEIRAELKGSSATAVQATTAGLASCIHGLEAAQAELEKWKNQLEIARLQAEVAHETAKLRAIQAKIALVASVITKVAGMVAGVAGVAASAASSLAGAEMDPAETFGKAAPGVVIDRPVPGGPSWGGIAGGASRIAGSGNLIEAGMSAAFFSSEIGAITARIQQLDGEISQLGIKNVKLDSVKFDEHFQAATKDYEAASHQADDAQQNFFNSMRMAGRTYDQQDLSRAQADATQGATARTSHNSTSMEALFAMVAALQSRGAARSTFGVMLASSSHLRDAGEIQRLALVSDRAAMIPTARGIPVLARPDIDYDDPSQGFKTFPDTRREALALRITVNTILQAIAVYDKDNPGQTALEQTWMSVVSKATSNLVH